MLFISFNVTLNRELVSETIDAKYGFYFLLTYVKSEVKKKLNFYMTCHTFF